MFAEEIGSFITSLFALFSIFYSIFSYLFLLGELLYSGARTHERDDGAAAEQSDMAYNCVLFLSDSVVGGRIYLLRLVG